ncbi:MAG TPA: hypothetical protein VFR97_11405 [Capillimicrobium sp.]|nr:hypothetical protein [Capillimicrobium sp.]
MTDQTDEPQDDELLDVDVDDDELDVADLDDDPAYDPDDEELKRLKGG